MSQHPFADWNTHLLELIMRPSLTLKSNQMCVPLKRQVVHYIICLFILLHSSPTQRWPLSVWTSQAVLGGTGEWDTGEWDGLCLVCHTFLSSAELAEDLSSAWCRRFTASCISVNFCTVSICVSVCVSKPMSVFPPCASVCETCVWSPRYDTYSRPHGLTAYLFPALSGKPGPSWRGAWPMKPRFTWSSPPR